MPKLSSGRLGGSGEAEKWSCAGFSLAITVPAQFQSLQTSCFCCICAISSVSTTMSPTVPPRKTKIKAPTARTAPPRKSTDAPLVEQYEHKQETVVTRPDAGKTPPQQYRDDSSLSPALDWDGQNAAREQSEALIRQILEAKNFTEAKAAAEKLKALGQPFLSHGNISHGSSCPINSQT